MIKYSFFLNAKESRAIDSVLAELGLNQRALAEEVGLSPSSITRYLTGKLAVSPNSANALYDALGKDERIDFLVKYQTDPPMERSLTANIRHRVSSPESIAERNWVKTYNAYANTLRGVFVDSSSEKRGRIIGSLEKLIEEYKAPS